MDLSVILVLSAFALLLLVWLCARVCAWVWFSEKSKHIRSLRGIILDEDKNGG